MLDQDAVLATHEFAALGWIIGFLYRAGESNIHTGLHWVHLVYVRLQYNLWENKPLIPNQEPDGIAWLNCAESAARWAVSIMPQWDTMALLLNWFAGGNDGFGPVVCMPCSGHRACVQSVQERLKMRAGLRPLILLRVRRSHTLVPQAERLRPQTAGRRVSPCWNTVKVTCNVLTIALRNPSKSKIKQNIYENLKFVSQIFAVEVHTYTVCVSKTNVLKQSCRTNLCLGHVADHDGCKFIWKSCFCLPFSSCNLPSLCRSFPTWKLKTEWEV